MPRKKSWLSRYLPACLGAMWLCGTSLYGHSVCGRIDLSQQLHAAPRMHHLHASRRALYHIWCCPHLGRRLRSKALGRKGRPVAPHCTLNH